MRNAIVVVLAILLMNYSMPYNVTITRARSIQHAEARVFSETAVNEIESVFELITEEWLDIEDCVPEQDTDDAPEDIAKAKSLYLIEIATSYISNADYRDTSAYFIHNTPFIIGLILNKPTPPPDVIVFSA